MGQIEQLADLFGQHISTPWQRTIAGAQRVIMVVFDKELERTLRARKVAFETATAQAGHNWLEVDVTDAFASWLGNDDYREAYFESPEDLQLKLDAEFAEFVAERVRGVLVSQAATDTSVVALFGVGALFGFTRMSKVLKLVEGDIRGRLAVFFPGQYGQNNYQLYEARDGWDYLAVPITLHSSGGVA